MSKKNRNSRQGQHGNGQVTDAGIEDLRSTQRAQQELQKFSMETVQAAASEIRKFKPVNIELLDREGKPARFTVRKLSWEHFEEGLQQFVDVAGPFLSSEKNVEDTDDLIAALRQAPEFVNFMVRHSCDMDEDATQAFRKDNFDNAVVLALAGMSVSFINNGAVRSFFVTAATVSQSVALEQQSAQKTGQQ